MNDTLCGRLAFTNCLFNELFLCTTNSISKAKETGRRLLKVLAVFASSE